MKVWSLCAAILVAGIFAGPVRAQDVTLTARDGGLALVGTLQGWDGDFYRIDKILGGTSFNEIFCRTTNPKINVLCQRLVLLKLRRKARFQFIRGRRHNSTECTRWTSY